MKITKTQLRQIIKEQLEEVGQKKASGESLQQKILDIIQNEVVPLAIAGELKGTGLFDSDFWIKAGGIVKVAKAKGAAVGRKPNRSPEQIKKDREAEEEFNIKKAKQEEIQQLKDKGWTAKQIKHYFSPEEVAKRAEFYERQERNYAQRKQDYIDWLKSRPRAGYDDEGRVVYADEPRPPGGRF